MTIYLIWRYGADYSNRNRPEMYTRRELLGASTRKKHAYDRAEQLRNAMGGIERENNEIRVTHEPNL